MNERIKSLIELADPRKTGMNRFTRPRPNAFWFTCAIVVGCLYWVAQQYYWLKYKIIDKIKGE